MNLFIRVLALSVVVAIPAYPQARGTLNVAGPAAAGSATAVDYEAIRLSKVARAVRVTDEISLDGHLDEAAWESAVPVSGFIQRLPTNGAPSGLKNVVRILYDDNNLYIGWFAYDEGIAHIGVNELREDFNFQENESLSVIIDSLHDRRSGFAFATNPEGAKRDMQISNDGSSNPDWDGVWDVKVSKNNEGWIAEYRIPFKTLRFADTPTQVWGFSLARKVVRLNEESGWTAVPIRYTGLRVSLAGTLEGIENIHQGRNLKVKPYIAAGITQVRSGTELKTLQSLSRLKDYDGGFDAKYSITSQLTLDATYHTDFAQVEADQQQVNLTRFNISFPEKRDFFLENSGTFNFGPGGNLVPFFSRTIGLSGGTPVAILGGSRVSGKAGKFDLGVLAMKTDKAVLSSAATAPSNNYFVGRIKRNLFRNSYVGTLVTSRDSSVSGDYNRLYGNDAHFQFYQRLDFDSYFLMSDTPGKSGKNQARRFQTGYRDDEFSIGAEYNEVQPNFNPEVGFIRRRDVTQFASDIAWKPLLRKSHTVRNLSFSSAMDYFEGSGSGKVETRTQDAAAGIQFVDGASVTFSANQTFDRLVSPFKIRTDIAIPAGDYTYLSYSGRFSSNQSLRVSGNGNYDWGQFWNGNHRAAGGALGLKIDHHLNIDLNYSRNHITLPNGAFTTELAGARLIYAFTPRAFLNAYFQYNADTHQVSSNIRFNITHHPLSDLYLVYNDTRDLHTHQLVGRAFIVKLTNLFNF